MKIISTTTGFLVLIIQLFSVQVMQAQWVKQSCANDTMYFRSVTFTDQDHGFAVGGGFVSKAAIYSTDNGGQQWKLTFEGSTNEYLKKIVMVNSKLGFIVGDSSGVIHFRKTTDGGKSWQIYQKSKAFGSLDDVVFTDSLHGFAIGTNMMAYGYYTRDGGNTWMASSAPAYMDMSHISFKDANTGYILGAPSSGGNAQYLKTTDGGKSWSTAARNGALGSASYVGPRIYIGSMTYISALINNAIRILKSSDDGQNWSLLPPNELADVRLRELLFTSDSTAYALAISNNRSIIWKSTDGGQSWKADYTPAENTYLNEVFMLSDDKGYCVGGNGLILARSESNGIEDTKPQRLSIYPNPVMNDNGTLILMLDHSFSGQIMLLDAMGRQVYSESQVDFKGGNYTLHLPGGLPKGIYFLDCLSAGKKLEARLIIE